MSVVKKKYLVGWVFFFWRGEGKERGQLLTSEEVLYSL